MSPPKSNQGCDDDDDDDQKVASVHDLQNPTNSQVNQQQQQNEESMPLTSDQQMMYHAAQVALNESLSEFLSAPIPKVVSVELVQPLLLLTTLSSTAIATTRPESTAVATLFSTSPSPSSSGMTPEINRTTLPVLNHRHGGVGPRNHDMIMALEELEGLEKEEQTLAHQTSLTRYLTELLTGQTYENSTVAIQSLDALEEAVPRRVCQHPFRKNDIVWVCRTCQADETCVLCHTCFSQSNHEGHDVAFYHAQAGGCCDCGDPDGRLYCIVVCVVIVYELTVMCKVWV